MKTTSNCWKYVIEKICITNCKVSLNKRTFNQMQHIKLAIINSACLVYLGDFQKVDEKIRKLP